MEQSDWFNKDSNTKSSLLGDAFSLLMAFVTSRSLRLRDLFSQFDKDGNQEISLTELREGIRVGALCDYQTASFADCQLKL